MRCLLKDAFIASLTSLPFVSGLKPTLTHVAFLSRGGVAPKAPIATTNAAATGATTIEETAAAESTTGAAAETDVVAEGAAAKVDAGAELGVNGTANATGNATEPEPLPPCTWALDEHGVARPVNCTQNALNETRSDCVLEEHFDTEVCEPPVILPCQEFPNLNMRKDFYEVTELEVEADEEEEEEEEEGDKKKKKKKDAEVVETAAEEKTEKAHLAEAVAGEAIENPEGGKADNATEPAAEKPEPLPLPPGYVAHGGMRIIKCAEQSEPTSKLYPVATWGEEWYPGPRETQAFCNNGTWTNMRGGVVATPKELSCFTKKQIRLLKEMIHYRKESKKKIEETAKEEYAWIDTVAEGRKGALNHAVEYAGKMYNQSMEGNMPEASAFQTVIDGMIENRLDPNGKPFTQETCDNLARHFVHKLKQPRVAGVLPNEAPKDWPEGMPHDVEEQDLKDHVIQQAIPVTCQYTEQKTSTGWDYMNSKPILAFRNGCFCQSQWAGGCPWKIGHQPNYASFGFTSMDAKFVHGAASVKRAAGSPPNALCWYWSEPLHPEHGYNMNVETGYEAFHAPAANGMDLQKALNAKKGL